MRPDSSGLVVAGGRSRRFGPADKAFAPVGGRPMLARVLDALRPVVDEVVVNCRLTQRDRVKRLLRAYDCPTRVAIDPVPDAGPLAGLETGLAAARGERVVAVPCDRPALASELLVHLRDAGGEAAVPWFEGHPQPLCAAYDRVAARRGCAAALEDGDDRARALLDRLDDERVPAETVRERGWATALRDVDTQRDRQRLRAALRS